MTTVFLVRHGLNDHLKSRKLAGWTPGIHLNEAGRAQARALAEHFGQIPVKAVYSSPLERTMETAQPIAAARGLEVVVRPGLGELRYGKWEGRSLKSLSRTKLWARVQRAPSLARFPQGESFAEAQARMVAELDAFRAEHPGSKDAIVCVSHADTIKLAAAHYLGLALDLFQRLLISPASITTFVLEVGSVQLVGLNDTRADDLRKRG